MAVRVQCHAAQAATESRILAIPTRQPRVIVAWHGGDGESAPAV